MEDSTKAQPAPVEEDEIASEYANSLLFAPNIWDLKILFGELSRKQGQGVDWHTSITLPWAQAKLMAYYLAANIAFHELHNGPIRVPESMIPPEPPPPTKSGKDEALFQFIKEHRQKFLESLK